jgi:hypothetical protein
MKFDEFTVVSDQTGAQAELTRQMKGIIAEQQKTIERLRKEGEAFEKEDREFQEESHRLRQEYSQLKEESSQLDQEIIKLDQEKELAASLTQKIRQLGGYMKKGNELAGQFNQQVLKRGDLTTTLVANVEVCVPLRGEKLARQFPITLASYEEVTREMEKENVTLAQAKEIFNAFEEVIEQMKAELDKVALTNQSLYDRDIAHYHEACNCLENLKLKFKPSLDYRAKNDKIGGNCGEILDNLEERLEQEKISNIEEKDSSPEKTPPLSPKDPSIAKTSSESSGDEHSPVSSTTARLQSAMNQQPAAARNAPKMPGVAFTPAAPQQKPVVGEVHVPQGALAAGSLYKEKEAAGKKQGKQEADKAVKKEKCALM